MDKKEAIAWFKHFFMDSFEKRTHGKNLKGVIYINSIEELDAFFKMIDVILKELEE